MSEAIGIVERLNDLRLAAFRAGGFDTPAAKAYYRALSTAFQRDELVDAAETSRLTARIAELEQRLKPFADRASTDTVQDADKFNILLVITNGKRMCAIDPKAFVEARTTLEASERGGGE